MKALYWKSYPLKIPAFIASAFRMPEGKHQIRVDLVNATTRQMSPIATATVESTSSCIITPVYGEREVLISEPGVYFVNADVDGNLVGTDLLFAETDRPKYSYDLHSDALAQVAAGELLILQKRARQVNRE